MTASQELEAVVRRELRARGVHPTEPAFDAVASAGAEVLGAVLAEALANRDLALACVSRLVLAATGSWDTAANALDQVEAAEKAIRHLQPGWRSVDVDGRLPIEDAAEFTTLPLDEGCSYG